jgi:DNA-binding NarL/FixJ family response regulator
MEKLKIAILDDHKLFVEGFQLLLSKFTEVELIETYANHEQLLQDLKLKSFDILFIDIHLKGYKGWDVLPEILSASPNIKAIALTISSDGYDVDKMLQAGVVAYVTKDLSIKSFNEIMNKISVGEIYITPEAALNHRFRTKISVADLSQREIDVIKLLGKEKTASEIAAIMNLSEKTIELEKTRIIKKLGVKNIAGIVMMGFRLKILS